MDLITRKPGPITPLTAATPVSDLLRVDVSVTYAAGPPVLRNTRITVGQGEILGLVGLSGSGKSTLALAILGLLGYKGGRATGLVEFNGANLLGWSQSRMRKLRGKEIALVPQSPVSSLNPALTIGAQFREAWRAHEPESDYKGRVVDLLNEVNLPATAEFLSLYPRQLSVGMAQRVLIAMAVLHRPRLLIADEPTSALDVLTQAEIIQLLQKLNRYFGTAILYISHDLLSVGNLCHRIAILNGGEVVECGEPDAIFHTPRHEYTKRLIMAIPAHPPLQFEGFQTD